LAFSFGYSCLRSFAELERGDNRTNYNLQVKYKQYDIQIYGFICVDKIENLTKNEISILKQQVKKINNILKEEFGKNISVKLEISNDIYLE